jgi:hypothetical protein
MSSAPSNITRALSDLAGYFPMANHLSVQASRDAIATAAYKVDSCNDLCLMFFKASIFLL